MLTLKREPTVGPPPLPLAPPPQSRRPTPPAISVLPIDKHLLVMRVPRTAVLKYWQSIQPGAPAGIPTNASLPPVVRKMNDGDLTFFGQQLPFGHCSVLMRRARKKGIVTESPALREGGDNDDAPRVTGLDGLSTSGDSRKIKIYAYHIAAAQKAYTSPESGLSEDLLRSVAKDKTKLASTTKPLTVMHLCGNKWCVEGAHLVIGSKRYNEQQTACHRGLQSSSSSDQVAQIQASYCQHTVKCWTVVYKGDYNGARAHMWE